MKTRFIIELDPIEDRELLDVILAAVEGLKGKMERQVVVEPEPVPEPEPEPVPEPVVEKPPEPKRKRRTTAKKRKKKEKPAKRKLVETPIEPEIPEETFKQAEQEIIDAENKYLPDENDFDPDLAEENLNDLDEVVKVATEDAKAQDEAALKTPQKPGKVVELPVERPPEEPLDHNVLFSALVKRSVPQAIGLLEKHGLTRFSDAKDDTLMSMMEDAKELLQKLG